MNAIREETIVPEALERLLRTALIGAGATAVMDAWVLLVRQFGVPSLNFALLGRWLAHLPRGQWAHESISRAAPAQGELGLGLGLYRAARATGALIPGGASEHARDPRRAR